MASLQSLLATSLSVNEEGSIAQNAPHVVGLLLSGQLLESADEATVHKFKLRVSALLKSKQPIARWFGAYLSQIACQTNFAVLREHGGTWTGLLIHILELPKENPATHAMAVEALGKIFAQTWGKQELTRDVTTPRLPQYIKQVLKMAEGTKEEGFVSPLLSAIVPALNQIVKQNSTTFKPHAARYERLLLKVISTAYVAPYKVEPRVLEQVCEGFVLLHYATVKGEEPAVWRQSLNKVMAEIYATVFDMADNIVEVDSALANEAGSSTRLDVASTTLEEHGLSQTSDKLRVLFKLLGKFFTTGTKAEVKLPLGAIANFADNLFSLNKHTIQKRGVEKAMRANFLSVMDQVHLATAEITLKVVPVVGTMMLVHIEAFMHHVDVLSETSNSDLLQQLLNMAALFFRLLGNLPKAMLPLVSKLVTTSLALLQPRINKSSAALPDALAHPALFTVKPPSAAVQTVTSFFQTVIVTVTDLALPIRSRIDQYLIMTSLQSNSHSLQETLALSAVHPGKTSKYSILPMALRALPRNELLESIVHPRLLPLTSAIHNLDKSAALRPDVANEDDENDVEDTTVVREKRKLSSTARDEETAENGGASEQPTGFLANKRAKSAEAMDVDEPTTVTEEVHTTTNVALQFEPGEEKEVVQETVTTTVETTEQPASPEPVAETAAPVVASFSKPQPAATATAAPAAESDDDDDDDDTEMPAISLESSDDEE